MKNISKVFLIFIPTISLLAQSPAPRHDRDMDGPRKEKMEMMMMWRLTEDLELTEKQAETFFPKYRTHQEEMEKLRLEGTKSLQEIRELLNEKKSISDKDLDKAMKTFRELELKKTEARVNFVRSLKGTLTSEQRAKLMLAPHKMRQEARRNIMEHKKFRSRRDRMNRWH
ncbi:MAG: hypothetical protein IIB95_12690 [Candidatus Marinimicrobia bacterium]|nr:hypothetical protein [Candidatus Neomarinimicrobiota bacterium]